MEHILFYSMMSAGDQPLMDHSRYALCNRAVTEIAIRAQDASCRKAWF